MLCLIVLGKQKTPTYESEKRERSVMELSIRNTCGCSPCLALVLDVQAIQGKEFTLQQNLFTFNIAYINLRNFSRLTQRLCPPQAFCVCSSV